MTRKLLFATLLVVGALFASASAQEPTDYRWSLYVGGNYTGTNNFADQVGEYIGRDDEGMPEIGFALSGVNGFNVFDLRGHFYNDDNVDLFGTARIADQWKFKLSYRSLEHIKPTDLLANLEVRESLDREGISKGGKMITHEDLDPGSEYGFTRHEIKTEIEFNPRDAGWLKLSAAHRTILEKGDDQTLALMHCATCHIESFAAERDRVSHELSLGATAQNEKGSIGYEFGYRIFKSNAATPEIYYDSAAHPTKEPTAQKGDEFASRLIFEDEDMLVNLIPEVKKMSHALKGRYALGKGTLLARVSATTAKNDHSNLKTTIISGSAKYSVRLSPRASLRAQASGSHRDADEYFVDLPNYRDGRSGGGQDFDYTRYSILTGRRGNAETELTYRPDRRTTLAFLAGYEAEQRDDYPYAGVKQTTNRYIGQLKASYRPSVRVNARLKYRLELTDNPFTNYKGLFERSGQNVPGLVYYYQRDALRTGEITNQPTVAHQADFRLNLRPSPQFSAQVTANVTLETNDDLDSLDYERTVYQPAVSFTYTPRPEWNFFGSASYLFDESNGPVTVAIMDG